MTYRELFSLLRKKLLMIVCFLLAGILAAVILTQVFVSDRYTASATLCVRNKTEYPDGITQADLAVSTALATPAIRMLGSPGILANAAEQMGTHSAEELEKALSFEAFDGGLFRVSLVLPEKDDAVLSLTRYLEISLDEVCERVDAGALTVVDPVFVDKTAAPRLRNIALGAIAGFFLSFVFVLLPHVFREEREEKE